MEQAWFEMHDYRRRKLESAVWIPLRATQTVRSEGRLGYVGFVEEFFGAGSVAISQDIKEQAQQLSWSDVGIGHAHQPYVENTTYIPADQFTAFGDNVVGIHLVLEQSGNALEETVWHLHQDLVLGLDLKREGDVWLAQSEGYVEVARLRRKESGKPCLLEIRAEHLRDYLAARDMGLYITTYRRRKAVVESTDHIGWPAGVSSESGSGGEWEGRVTEIHEGGFFPFGSRTAVFHAGHADLDATEDVPTLPAPGEGKMDSASWEIEEQGRRLFSVWGELWKNEWVGPGSHSSRVRGDRLPSSITFIVDAEGKQLGERELRKGGRWLWFRPEVMMALSHRRGGQLTWYTRDTGGVSCSPGHGVHFGVNQLGLVNVYAKDVAVLPEWQQRIWAGFNIGPDGGVSEELFAAQARAEPADTQAPEPFLERGLALLNASSGRELGISLIREHEHVPEILLHVHRFRAVDREGLFALAKDLARLTADSINAPAVHQVLKLSKDDRPGSLKSLERLLATRIDPSEARVIVGPLVGIYEMRHFDAHLPGSEISVSLSLAGIDESAPMIQQGYQLIHSCVSAIYKIVRALSPKQDGALDEAPSGHQAVSPE